MSEWCAPQQRYRKGFRPTLPEEVQARLKEFEKTCLRCRVADALMCIMAIVLVATAIHTVLETASWWMALAVYLVGIIVIARQQRILEIFVHDASHGCWHRDKKRWNDTFANILVAWPTLTTVAAYWEFHRWHHAWFGSDKDPCKLRMLGKTGFVKYAVNWYIETAGKGSTLLGKWAAWHLIVFVLPAELLWGGGRGAALWFACWVVPMLTVLPAIRYVAEAEEHNYERADTEFATTFNNVGVLHRFFFHAKNDSYHVVHHMWPAIPMCRHAEVHRFALEYVPDYRAALLRTRVMERL